MASQLQKAMCVVWHRESKSQVTVQRGFHAESLVRRHDRNVYLETWWSFSEAVCFYKGKSLISDESPKLRGSSSSFCWYPKKDKNRSWPTLKNAWSSANIIWRLEVNQCQLLQRPAAKHKEHSRIFCCYVLSRLKDLKTELCNQKCLLTRRPFSVCYDMLTDAILGTGASTVRMSWLEAPGLVGSVIIAKVNGD